MILDRLRGDRPAFLGVALFASPAELAAMDVRVARCAGRPSVAEHRAGVTLRAGDAHVHPSQRERCAIVIELRDGSDRLPTRQGVAVIASNRKWTMRTTRVHTRGLRSVLLGHGGPREPK